MKKGAIQPRDMMRFAVEKTSDGSTQLILLNGRTHSIILSQGELKALIKALRRGLLLFAFVVGFECNLGFGKCLFESGLNVPVALDNLHEVQGFNGEHGQGVGVDERILVSVVNKFPMVGRYFYGQFPHVLPLLAATQLNVHDQIEAAGDNRTDSATDESGVDECVEVHWYSFVELLGVFAGIYFLLHRFLGRWMKRCEQRDSELFIATSLAAFVLLCDTTDFIEAQIKNQSQKSPKEVF